MRGRVWAMALATGLAGSPVVAQVAEPPSPRVNPADYLEAPIAPGIYLPPAKSNGNDLPGSKEPPVEKPIKPIAPKKDDAPAAKFSLPKDIKTVGADEFDDSKPSRKGLGSKAPETEELVDYLTSSRRREKKKKDDELWSSGRLPDFDDFGDKVKNVLDPDGPRTGFIATDHAYDCFISPVTNPFFFEDPRALTEIRPIFIYQKIPNLQPNFAGGSMFFYGAQARIALGQRFSIVMNKLGGITVNDGPNSPYGDNNGFAEFWVGPKVTLYRNEDTGTLFAAGATFQIPVGSDKVYQDTGSLSIVPYASFAKSFFKNSMGNFNFLASAGYSFSTNDQRSEYLYASGHLDFDIGSNHRWYPLVELNWFQYTKSGNARFIKGEGRDLVNFGSESKGSGLLTAAAGGRFKLTRNTELGAAYEFPIFGNKDFFQGRVTLDFIWRY